MEAISPINDWIIKQAPIVGVLAFLLYALWKRYEKYQDRTEAKLAETEARIQRYMEEDRKSMNDVMNRTAQALEEQSHTMGRANDVMACIVTEIQEFKRSEIYQEHQNRTNKRNIHHS